MDPRVGQVWIGRSHVWLLVEDRSRSSPFGSSILSFVALQLTHPRWDHGNGQLGTIYLGLGWRMAS